jgi:signal transduction histidine kinase
VQKVLSWLLPPVYKDAKKSKEAKHANVISISSLVIYFYAIVSEVSTGSYEYMSILVISFFMSLVLYVLNKKKWLPKPIMYNSICLLASAAGIMYLVDGSRDEVTLAFPVVLVISSLTFDRKALVITLLAELVILWGIGLAEINGVLTGRFAWGTNFFQLNIQSFILAVSAFIIDLIVGDKTKIISELNEKSKALENSNLELFKSNATKDKFFSIVAHDLRSPFQGLLGIANILEGLDEELTDDERKDFVTRLNTALKRQYDFLEELLLWGKFQRNAIVFQLEIHNLREIIEHNSELLSSNIYKKKLQLKINCPAELNINCDDHLFSTVIRNLLSNAIKYTPAGGLITVTAQEINNKVIIKVTDNGVGMSEERMNELFKIESNHSTRGTEDEAGTGLGLVLCKEIIDKHSGSITVISDEGRGTTFTVHVPKNQS